MCMSGFEEDYMQPRFKQTEIAHSGLKIIRKPIKQNWTGKRKSEIGTTESWLVKWLRLMVMSQT